MEKKLIVFGLIFILFAIGLSGCTNDDGTFIGTWKLVEFEGNPHHTNTTWTFLNNGTILINTVSDYEDLKTWLTYNLSDDKLHTNTPDGLAPWDFIYSFANGGNQLSLFFWPSPDEYPNFLFDKI